MTTLVVRGPSIINGTATVPGDKSISHRALMLGAAANGATSIRNLGSGSDVASTMSCLGAYGVVVERAGADAVVRSEGIRSWAAPKVTLDCGNSGTTIRILTGFAAHHAFVSTLDGDTSLRRRPMDRLSAPLGALGARVQTTGGRPPVRVEGGRLSGADVRLDVASAQVKSATIFAALGADGTTSVTEPSPSRDHTERLLRALGASIAEDASDGHRVTVVPFVPPSFEIDVPGDPSSGAFLVAAGVLAGRVQLDGVCLNPTRIEFLVSLARMGASVQWETSTEHLGEPVGTIDAERSELSGIGIEGPLVPAVLDELPLIAVLATQARGTTTVTGAGELRTKESDRIATMVTALRHLGAHAEELPDGFVVAGPTTLTGTKVAADGDHRVAMALAVAGLVAQGETLVEGYEAATVSWPGFEQVLASLGAEMELR
jgi:3-phosphoshikimate 1-carboxyvinyltransferase